MRFRIVNRLALSSPILPHRSFRHVSAQAKDPAIFENSLEKTLEEHRSVNRESLIRKVVARSDPKGPNHPILPSNEPAGSELSESRESSLQCQLPRAAIQLPTLQDRPKPHRRSKKSTKSANKGPLVSSSVPFHHPIDLRVKRGKREQCPWLDELKRSRRFSSGVSQLGAELRALEKYLTPTAREVEVADWVVSDITNLISKNTKTFKPPRCISTGFMMSNSVLNLTITVPDQRNRRDGIRKPSASRPERLRRYSNFLTLVWRTLEQCPTYEVRLFNRFTRSHAVVHKPTGLLFRIHCAEAEPAHLEYIRDFHAEYPTLRPLYMAIRLILQSRGLFGSANMSIDSSGLQVLIAAFLKINHGRFRGDTGCAEPFLAFLHTFGTEVDLTLTGVAADPPGFFNTNSVEEACSMYDSDDLPAYLRGQRSLINMKKNALKRSNTPLATRLLLQAPGNYMGNLGGYCSRTMDLQVAFAEAHRSLELALEAWEPSEQLTQTTSILNKALHANFEGFALQRASILAGGKAM